MFEKCKKKFRETESLPGTTSAWSVSGMGKRNRKDLRRLYGMDEVSQEIYDTIMRADNGDASDADHRILEQYIKEKKQEIRSVKRGLGIEGGGVARPPGRMAESIIINWHELKKYTLEEEDDGDD